MTTVLPEAADVPVPAVTSAGQACPSWCREVHGPGVTGWLATHQSTQYGLANPAPLEGYPEVMLRTQLTRVERCDQASRTVLYIAGDGDVELTADEADVFILQAQAFVDTLRVLRRQMGGDRAALSS
ncbi:DUF6907 domain-containing protein [Streptomyces sp. NPDC051578]|uniref:DUF6907 domain-containing protein n=1 Tax=Streptomyces sp. NPDC051578 TaxID=3365662 RepID=UPI003799C29A